MLLSTLFLLGSVTLCYTEGINVLPANIAGDMKSCAWFASWYTSNSRSGNIDDAKNDIAAFYDYANKFKVKSSGLLSEQTCNDIKWMFWNAAWYTANTRWSIYNDAKYDKIRMDKHYDNIVSSGEISESLASDLENMGWAAARYCASLRSGYDNDAQEDLAWFKEFSQKIGAGGTSIL